MTLRTETLTGPAIAQYVPALARLRRIVFRDWPYLYEGDDGQEQTYLSAFARSPDAALVVAFDGEAPVGCSTCLPLAHESANVRAPFEARGWEVQGFCYFGESVLLAEYRGQGIGVAFFAGREAHARTLPGVEFCCFCAVRRAADDPRRPPDAVPLDDFWRHRGYARIPDLACEMTWLEVDGAGKVRHVLDFWGKPLTGAALP